MASDNQDDFAEIAGHGRPYLYNLRCLYYFRLTLRLLLNKECWLLWRRASQALPVQLL